MKKGKNKKSFRRKGGNIFSENYKICWSYLKESKVFIFSIVGIFFAFAILGFFVSPPGDLYNQLMNYLKEIAGSVNGLSAGQLISFIFFNNARISFFAMFLGIAAGIFPLLAAMFNGYVLGFVSKMSVNADGFLVLWRLLPHGIFELPAVFISMGIGVKLGFNLIGNREKFKDNLHSALRVFLFIVIPLLIIAAVIEGSLIYFFGD